MDKKRKKILVFGSILLGIAIIGTVFSINYLIANTLDNLNFEIMAERIEKDEILTDTAFIIKSEKNYSTRLMNKIVSIEPSVNYTLSKTSKGTYLIKPESQLEDSSIYNIYINAEEDKPKLSWAFQTKADFKVINVFPGDLSTYVERHSAIEVSFSKPVNNIEGCFEISPQTSGRFEYLDKKVIFIPDELLKEDTIYKVTINKGLKNYYDEELKEDYSFSFRTATQRPYIGLLDGFQQSFNSKSTPKIHLSLSEDYNDATFSINVYKLNSVEEYTSYLETYYKNVNSNLGEAYDHIFDMSKHVALYSYSTMLIDDEAWYKSIAFPEKLSTGWYIVDITNSLNNIRLQKALQVSDLLVYMYGINKDVRVWINDVATNEAVSGATVQIGDWAAISNKDGVAEFDISKDSKQKVIITTKDGKEFGEYREVTNIENSNLNDEYYMYLYTDRKQYLPTDEINYWGMIIPRKSTLSIPQEVEVRIGDDISDKPKVDKNGIFSGSINITNHESTWSGIFIKVGEKENYVAEIQISDYIKPVYKLSSDFNKEYYRKGDKIELSVYGKFYDGTSAENVKVKVTQGNSEYKTVTLDTNGEAKAIFSPYSHDLSGDFGYIYATLEIAGIDEQATAYNDVLYFPTDYYINNEWDAGNKKLVLSANKIDYSAINNGNIESSKIYEGESFEQNVYAELIEITNERHYTGETKYDYYTGTYEPQYVYSRIENVIKTYDLVIPKNQKLTIEIPEIGENKNASYTIKLRYTYPDGFTGEKDVYAWAGNDSYTNNYYFENSDSSLKENDVARLTLSADNLANGTMLYIVSTDRINKLGVTDDGYLDVKMTKELIPNCLVSGAFFDGKNIYEIYNSYIFYEPEDKELLINITTDKEVYSPGDKVKAVAKVTDVNGKPVECSFLFSVVDEAALFDRDEGEILSKIYAPRYHMPLIFNSDTSNLFGEGGAGGGGDEIRDTFTNVLTFTPTHTDINGEATVEFDMSDDLTSWRITGIAISDDVKAGKTEKNIKTSIPFFINQVLNEKYTVQDDICFSLRVAGKNAGVTNSPVKYLVELLNDADEVIKTENREVKPLETVMVNFGKQNASRYKIRVTAESEDNKDSILKEFSVVESLHEILLTELIDIEEVKSLETLRYPIRLMIFDKNNLLYYKSLQKILDKSNGNTNEQILSRNYVHKKLNGFYGNELYDTQFDTILQNYSGNVEKIPNDGGDILFTAQIVANTSGYINNQAAKNKFYETLENSDALLSDVTAAYMGLAALKEPVLADIKYMLSNSNGLELMDKINLINALAYIGDYKGAREWYDSEIKPLITETAGGQKYISEKYETFYYQATSRILPTLSLIKHEDFYQILNYVLASDTKEYIPVMDLISFINSYNPTTDSKSSITYTIGEEKTKIDFSEEKMKILELNKNDFDNLSIQRVKGDVVAIVEYFGSIEEVNKNENEGIKIRKNVSKGEVGEYSTVSLNISLPADSDEYYILSDVIPTSSRYASVEHNYEYNWGIVKKDGQRLSFYINSKDSKNIIINYKIRNIFSGEFNLEPACITDRAGNVFYSNESEKFIVK